MTVESVARFSSGSGVVGTFLTINGKRYKIVETDGATATVEPALPAVALPKNPKNSSQPRNRAERRRGQRERR